MFGIDFKFPFCEKIDNLMVKWNASHLIERICEFDLIYNT